MSDRPRIITLINKKTQKRRIIHLVTKTKEKSFKFASANCKQWILKNGFPTRIKISYEIKDKEDINDIDCSNLEDVNYALRAFVKEYLEP